MVATSSSERVTRLQVFVSQVLVVFGLFFARLLSPFFRQPIVPWPKSGKGDALRDTVTVVTGANAGIGLAIAEEHFRRGSHVFLACRNAKRANEARRSLLEKVTGSNPALLTTVTLDTSSLTSVRRSVDEIADRLGGNGGGGDGGGGNKKIDFLFLNAGIVDKQEDVDRFTQDGLEVVYETNFLGHFLFVNLALDRLSDTCRVVITASAAAITVEFDRQLALKSQKAEEPGFHFNKTATSWLHLPGKSMPRYNSTKAMQVIFTRMLQKRFDKESQTSGRRRRTVNAYHPGFVQTQIFTTFGEIRRLVSQPGVLWLAGLVALRPSQGAQTALWLAHTQEAEPGGFYDRTNKLSIPFYLPSDNAKTAERLWQRWNNDAGLREADWTTKLSE